MIDILFQRVEYVVGNEKTNFEEFIKEMLTNRIN